MRDIVISSGFTSSVQNWLGGLQRPYKFILLPTPDKQQYGPQVAALGKHPIMTLIEQSGVKDPGRVMVCGFSESCQLVMAFLRSQDAALIEHAIMIDGIHCSWHPYGSQPNADKSNIAPTCLGPIIGYADWAGSGPTQVDGLPPAKRFCTITHTHIVPGYPGTSDTARAILNKLYGSGWPKQAGQGVSALAGLNGFEAAYGQHGLTVASFASGPGDKAAHIYQGTTVLRTVIESMVVPRWNSVDPTVPQCGVQTVYGNAAPLQGGQSCDPNAPNLIPTDGGDHDGSVPWQKYYDPSAVKSDEPWTGWQIAGAVLGGAAALGALGYGGWWLSRRYRKHNPVYVPLELAKKGDWVELTYQGETVHGKVVHTKKDGVLTVHVVDSSDEDVEYVDVHVRKHNPAQVIPLGRAWHGRELPAGYHDAPSQDHAAFVLILPLDGSLIIESGWSSIDEAQQRLAALRKEIPQLRGKAHLDVGTRMEVRAAGVNPDNSRWWASSTRRA